MSISGVVAQKVADEEAQVQHPGRPSHVDGEAVRGGEDSPDRSRRPSSAASTLKSLDPEKSPKVIAEKSRETNAEEARYQVAFEGPNDSEDPKNWGVGIRSYYTGLGGILVLNATFASSSPSGIARNVMEDFGVTSTTVGTLMISLFVTGYCVGPLFWGPLSESFGRRPIFITSFLVYTLFQVGTALSPNMAAILVFRFLGGCFAASPLANSGALMSDIWDAKSRGNAIAIFSVAPFAGPALGPIAGGFIGTSNASWRWLFWTLSMFAGTCLILIIFTLPETHAPTILGQKAKRLRKETGDPRYYAPIEVMSVSFGQRCRDIVAKPFKILFLEPMLLLVTIYMSFVYGCLYLLFEAYPVVFIEGHGFNAGTDGLAFLPLFISSIFAAMASVWYYNPKYVKLIEQYAPNPPPPEARLPMGVVGGVIFAVGFFWFGWTSYTSISYWAPLMAGCAFGFSCMLIFLSLFNYIIDVYLKEAASALSANTVVRSLFGATFPLFASQMYKALNPRWASTLVGCVAVIMIPIPLLFIRYGAGLRARSRYSPKLEVS